MTHYYARNATEPDRVLEPDESPLVLASARWRSAHKLMVAMHAADNVAGLLIICLYAAVLHFV